MKHSRLFFCLICFTLSISLTTSGQTNVSGGIYSNTTWTLANSPYIVTDTVVVFPGVILTIQPGVTVKFADNIPLEVRQSQLIALGTSIAPISFTSNSGSPTPGIYSGIQLNAGNMISRFNYCNFEYAAFGLSTNTIPYTLTVKNSNVMSNQYGIYSVYSTIDIDSCSFLKNTLVGLSGDGTVNHCTFLNNGVGLEGGGNYPSVVSNCLADSNQTGIKYIVGPVLNSRIEYNQIGLTCMDYTAPNNCVISKNQIGINILSLGDTVRNCFIDSNTIVGVRMFSDGMTYLTNCVIKSNGIGISDSTHFSTHRAVIVKNYIEHNGIGIILSSDADSISCNRICGNNSYDLKYLGTNNTNSVTHNYWCTPDSASTRQTIYDGYVDASYGLVSFMPIDSSCFSGITASINEASVRPEVAIFPNPSNGIFSIALHNPSPSLIEFFNTLGETIQSVKIISDQTTLNLSTQPKGIYFYRVLSESKLIGSGKLVIE